MGKKYLLNSKNSLRPTKKQQEVQKREDGYDAGAPPAFACAAAAPSFCRPASCAAPACCCSCCLPPVAKCRHACCTPPTTPPPQLRPRAGSHAFETIAAAFRHVQDPRLEALMWLQAEASRGGYGHTLAEMVQGAGLLAGPLCRGQCRTAGWAAQACACASRCASPHPLYARPACPRPQPPAPAPTPGQCSSTAACWRTRRMSPGCAPTRSPCCATTAPSSSTPVRRAGGL